MKNVEQFERIDKNSVNIRVAQPRGNAHLGSCSTNYYVNW